MQKTKEITFEGVTATISSDYTPKKVSVKVKDPDISEILEGINNEDLIGWVQSNRDPEGVFTNEQLEMWAESNGYIKE